MRNLLAFLFLSTLILATGCSEKAAKKVAVSGTVTLDNQPMADGEISFAAAGAAPEVLPVKDGKFQGQLTVGSKKVEIRAYKDVASKAAGGMYAKGEMPGGGSNKENYIPAKYNSESTLTAEVTDSGVNPATFAATSK